MIMIIISLTNIGDVAEEVNPFLIMIFKIVDTSRVIA